MSKAPYVSIVTPVYGCRTCLAQLYSRLAAVLTRITPDFEIIMVNDASPDGAWEIIEELAQRDPRVKGINLSRNFGQHQAITAGLDYTTGEWVIVMDCDLQDQPEQIPVMFEAARSGFDVVFGRRANRQDTFLKRLSSQAFGKVLSTLMGQRLDPAIANFGVYHCKVIESFRRIHDVDRSFPIFVRWLGFRQTVVDIEHAERAEGRSSYTLAKLITFAVATVAAYSNKPLVISIYLGAIFSTLSFLAAIYFVIRFLTLGVGVEGWTSLMVSLYFIAGLLLANLGVLGLYVGKSFEQAKGRPLYVVRDLRNLGSEVATSAALRRSAPEDR
jgi:glycosyltransferase involved in cell wall biosynthesis